MTRGAMTRGAGTIRAEAVLFDWGGTLIDYPAANSRPEAHRECVLAAYESLVAGGLLDEAVGWERFHEVYMRETLALIRMGAETHVEHTFLERFVRSFDVLQLEQPEAVRFEPTVEALAAALIARCRPVPGALEVLKTLKGRIPVGLLSNFPHRPVVDITLQTAGFVPLFDHIVVSADLGFVKPHPEIYRVAARGLGVAPEACIYVGDEPVNDVKGPAAAGLATVQVPSHHKDVPGIEPDFRIERLHELLDLPPLAHLGLRSDAHPPRTESAT